MTAALLSNSTPLPQVVRGAAAPGRQGGDDLGVRPARTVAVARWCDANDGPGTDAAETVAARTTAAARCGHERRRRRAVALRPNAACPPREHLTFQLPAAPGGR